MRKVFELKLSSGEIVTWQGETGTDAAKRYVDTFPSKSVVAWRVPPIGLRVGLRSGNIVE